MAIIITYRHTRRLSMRIAQNGDVRVSAPLRTPRIIIEAFIEKNQDWIVKAQARTAERLQQRAAFYDQLSLNTPAERKEATNRLRAIVDPMFEHYRREMNAQPSRITFRRSTSRWGSCNHRTRSISLSIYLLLLPEWCIEHVVVHELAHLHQPNHGPAFYALMDRHFPRWREARAETRRLSRNESEE
ncbi:MAG: M48 family metallopeptidase [Prevotella sp.]|nr:M48 family metallopeptidase [Prevotella sp.]